MFLNLKQNVQAFLVLFLPVHFCCYRKFIFLFRFYLCLEIIDHIIMIIKEWISVLREHLTQLIITRRVIKSTKERKVIHFFVLIK